MQVRKQQLELDKGNLLQYSCLENPIDRGTWWATVHGVARVGHNLATEPPSTPTQQYMGTSGSASPKVLVIKEDISIKKKNARNKLKTGKEETRKW